jgi:hypothetical protein
VEEVAEENVLEHNARNVQLAGRWGCEQHIHSACLHATPASMLLLARRGMGMTWCERQLVEETQSV